MTNYLAAKLSRRLVQRSPAMRDEDGSAAKPDQFWGPINPLMYRFVSKVRTDPFSIFPVALEAQKFCVKNLDTIYAIPLFALLNLMTSISPPTTPKPKINSND